MNKSFTEAQQRWDSFLEKIETRFHEILSQTEAVLPNVLAFQDFDPTPFSVAWQGIETQAKELIAKIHNTWEDKVSPTFDEAKDAGEAAVEEAEGSLDDYYERFYKLYYIEQEKGNALANKLEKALKGYDVRTFAEAARKLQQKATEVLTKNFLCTQCKAPLPVKQNFFRSYYQTCEYCQTVNTFEPGSIARNVEHFALHPLSEEKALKEYYAYWDIENKFKSQRDDEPQTTSPQQVLDAYKLYAEKYLKARIEIIPDLEKEYEKDLTAKVEHVRKWVLGEHGWNYTNPLDNKTYSFITREFIEKVMWQMVEYHYPDEEEEIEEDTCLGNFENNMDSFLEDLEETFGIYIEDASELTIEDIIDNLFANRDNINLGDNVDKDGNWRSYEEELHEEEDED